MRDFWDAAIELEPDTTVLDEGARFNICPMAFADFDAYWNPFLSGQAPGLLTRCRSMESRRLRLRDLIRSRVSLGNDGEIELVSGAWAAKGRARR